MLVGGPGSSQALSGVGDKEYVHAKFIINCAVERRTNVKIPLRRFVPNQNQVGDWRLAQSQL
jgi:hypothetical protein